MYKFRRQGSGRYRFAGYKLCDDNVFNKTVVERIAPLWDKDMSVISKWNVLHDEFVNTGESITW